MNTRQISNALRIPSDIVEGHMARNEQEEMERRMFQPTGDSNREEVAGRLLCNIPKMKASELDKGLKVFEPSSPDDEERSYYIPPQRVPSIQSV